MTHTFLLYARKGFALGDVTLLTALARDIHLGHPGKYRLLVDTHFAALWHNNPRVEQADYRTDHQLIRLNYANGISSSKRCNRHHFLSWFHKDFELRTGVVVPVRLPKGEFFLSEAEERPPIEGRYWVVLAGGKLDMTTKHWGSQRYQRLVDLLAPEGVRFVQCGARHRKHSHPPLFGVLDAVGRYDDDVRQFLSLIRHADGVVCGVTGAMHVAACFDKPCVVLAGGREEPWWESYTNEHRPYSFGSDCEPVWVEHKYLHTMGRLPCCEKIGCWKSHTTPEEGNNPRGGLCEMPLLEESGASPQCMALITPEQAARAVLSYYHSGVLPAPMGGTPRWAGGAPSTLEAVTAILPAPTPTPIPIPPAHTPTLTPGSGKNYPASLNHPALGGKLTVFVLCYGPHADLAKRCLNSLVHSMPPGSFDLRVACNACPPETVNYVKSLPASRIYLYPENKLKYPVMRELFRDPGHPITTRYVLWFDDDSFAVHPLWLNKLCDAVAANHAGGCRLYGAEFLHDFARLQVPGHRPDMWFRNAPWHRGRDFLAGRQARLSTPNGSVIRFVAGGFWALGVDALQAGDIPDARLLHNGGDICIGEQVRQAGFKTFGFNAKKEFIHTSGAPPRGQSRVGADKRFPWQLGGELG